MITVPFEKRLIMLGSDNDELYDRKSIKDAVKNFRFSSDPAELEREFNKLESVPHNCFGCVDTSTMRIAHEFFSANWLAGGRSNDSLFKETFDRYYVTDGRLTSLVYRIDYYAFMLGTGEYLGDTEDIFGNDDHRRLLIATRKDEISEMFLNFLNDRISNCIMPDYTELDLDDIIL